MKKLYVIPIFALLIIILGGCDAEGQYPYIAVQNNCWTYSRYNRQIPIGNDYKMDQLNSYDVVETEKGIDVIIHFEDATEEPE